MKKFYVTTPIYYVNDSPHIGHTYTTVAADVLARWNRFIGSPTFFLTGTDEHGAKILESAKKMNREPKEHCDAIAGEFKSAWKKMNISNDDFIRTTDTRHEQTVREFLNKLYTNKKIYKAKYNGLYCVQCERFLVDTELEGGLCPDHKTRPVEQSEENYFFKLSDYRKKLIDIISNGSMVILPEGRKKEILGKLKLGLEDISISRANLPWAIPLPFDEAQTTYVWIDALINYISGCPQNFWPANVHLIGKDILWFHSVIWPALLLAVGLPLPEKIYAHGFFTVNGQKMSKTIGNVIRVEELTDKFGVDATRYLLLSAFPFGTDGDFSMDGLKEKYNSDLANNIGNLVSRVVTMVEKYTEGRIPESRESKKLWNELLLIKEHYENLDFNKILDTILKTVDSVNRYIDSSAPWKLAKEKNSKLNDVLSNLCETLWVLAHYLYPIMPQTAQRIWEQLGQAGKIESSNFLLDNKIVFTKVGSVGTEVGSVGKEEIKITRPKIPLFPRLT